MKETHDKRTGRPPAGVEGERVRDYPRVMLRLPALTVARLKAWSHVRDTPVWRLIDEAVNQAIDRLDGEDSRLVRTLARRSVERDQGKE